MKASPKGFQDPFMHFRDESSISLHLERPSRPPAGEKAQSSLEFLGRVALHGSAMQ